MQTFAAGFSLGLSLIIAIGAQNAFVLRQGLLRRHVAAVCMLCAVSDAALILAGVGGFEVLLKQVPQLLHVARYGGAAFLIAYGARSFYNAWRAPHVLHAGGSHGAGHAGDSLRVTLLTCAALTWLNPHVYLDTVILLGSVSTQYTAKAYFAGGAVASSFAFFFTLGYAARFLSPLFAKPPAWRILDAFIGVVMCTIAASLLIEK